MRISEYKKINERTEEYTVTIPAEYNEDGVIIAEEHEEVLTRTIPIMGLIYRDATQEEIAEMQGKTPPVNYGEAVNNAIRERYSVSQEFAILRQKDEKPEEYAEYYAYCEECKEKVKQSM